MEPAEETTSQEECTEPVEPLQLSPRSGTATYLNPAFVLDEPDASDVGNTPVEPRRRLSEPSLPVADSGQAGTASTSAVQARDSTDTGDNPFRSRQESSASESRQCRRCQREAGNLQQAADGAQGNQLLRSVDRFALTVFQLLLLIFTTAAFVVMLRVWHKVIESHAEGNSGNDDAAAS
ncbi:uncharacterized protein LOC144119717 [Amblyomma americanum]